MTISSDCYVKIDEPALQDKRHPIPLRSPPFTEEKRNMNSIADMMVTIAILAVAGVLVLGLVNMLRGGSPSRSQNLMRLRVVLQFLALIVIMSVVWRRGIF